jgi:hypothetical protein
VSNLLAVKDYVEGRLSDADREAFEQQLLQDPTVAQELEELLQLREGLAMLRDQGELLALRRPRQRGWWWGVAGAAAASLAAILIYNVFLPARSPTIAPSIAALRAHAPDSEPLAKVYTFARVRDATLVPELDLPVRGVLEIRALTSTTDGGRQYSMLLQETPLRRVGVIEHLTPDADGFVVIYAEASQLKAGNYELIVRQEAAPAADQHFAFRLIRP